LTKPDEWVGGNAETADISLHCNDFSKHFVNHATADGAYTEQKKQSALSLFDEARKERAAFFTAY
jgi:hypothetical protein